MKRAAEIVTALAGRGITLTVEAGQLHARPGHRITDDNLQLIRDNKPALVHLLSARADADQAGHAVAHESPRPLEPQEKASIATFCRREYGSADDNIADTIAEAEANPAYRGYLAALAKAAEGDQ